jgi:hypothetical protein
MSAFILPTTEIDTLVSTLALNSAAAKAFEILAPIVRDSISLEAVAYNLHSMNVDAVNARYDEDTQPHYRPSINESNASSLEAIERIASCLRYNSAEGNVPTRPLWIAIDQIADLLEVLAKEEKREANRAKLEQARQQDAQAKERGFAWMAANKPDTATHAIIAELHQDESDSQSDYFSSRRVGYRFLGWSTHGRDLFSEMRKAAATCEDTRHLGPGCNEYSVQLNGNPQEHWAPFSLLDVNGVCAWNTETEAQAALAAALAEDAASNAAVPFLPYCPNVPYGAKIHCESVEHREKWSMGSGYFLQRGSKHSGWRVHKVECGSHLASVIGHDARLFTAPAATPAATEKPTTETPAPAVAVAEVQVTENTEKNGVEIRFPSKPPAFLLTTLKSLGWKWSKFSACWYRTATDDARKLAHDIAATWTATQA